MPIIAVDNAVTRRRMPIIASDNAVTRRVLSEQSGSFSNKRASQGGPSAHQLTLSKKNGRLGVTCVNNPDGAGVLISALVADTICWSQGLNVGDLIMSINGRTCDDHQAAVAAIDDSRDDYLTLTLDGLTRRLVVDRQCAKVGITVCNCAGGRGVEVMGVVPGGAAEQAGVAEGDVLVSVDGGLVTCHEQAIERIDAAGPRFEMVLLGGGEFC